MLSVSYIYSKNILTANDWSLLQNLYPGLALQRANVQDRSQYSFNVTFTAKTGQKRKLSSKTFSGLINKIEKIISDQQKSIQLVFVVPQRLLKHRVYRTLKSNFIRSLSGLYLLPIRFKLSVALIVYTGDGTFKNSNFSDINRLNSLSALTKSTHDQLTWRQDCYRIAIITGLPEGDLHGLEQLLKTGNLSIYGIPLPDLPIFERKQLAHFIKRRSGKYLTFDFMVQYRLNGVNRYAAIINRRVWRTDTPPGTTGWKERFEHLLPGSFTRIFQAGTVQQLQLILKRLNNSVPRITQLTPDIFNLLQSIIISELSIKTEPKTILGTVVLKKDSHCFRAIITDRKLLSRIKKSKGALMTCTIQIRPVNTGVPYILTGLSNSKVQKTIELKHTDLQESPAALYRKSPGTVPTGQLKACIIDFNIFDSSPVKLID